MARGVTDRLLAPPPWPLALTGATTAAGGAGDLRRTIPADPARRGVVAVVCITPLVGATAVVVVRATAVGNTVEAVPAATAKFPLARGDMTRPRFSVGAKFRPRISVGAKFRPRFSVDAKFRPRISVGAKFPLARGDVTRPTRMARVGLGGAVAPTQKAAAPTWAAADPAEWSPPS